MTNKQFQTLVRAVFVAGWIAGGEASATAACTHAVSAADKFLEEEGFGKDKVKAKRGSPTTPA